MLDKGSFSDHIHIQTNKAQAVNAQQIALVQEEANEEFKETLEIAFNPIAMRNRFERLEGRVRKPGKEETEKPEKSDEIDFQIEGVQETAEQFEQKNPELAAEMLLSLRSRLSKKSSPDELLNTILSAYSDVSLADESLDFLIATSEPELAQKLLEAKEKLHKTYEREIRAGKNIMSEAQTFSKQNLGTPTSLRDLYRDITGNPRDPSTLFAELSLKYTFDKMKTVIAFMLHSLGQDLRSKGPSIEPGELSRLMTETRSMQSILGVYLFFQSRMRLIETSFYQHDLVLPSRINFENLARGFVKLILEKYPSPDKILQMAEELGLSEDLLAEIIIISQMKDAIRQVSPRLYRSEQHKQDIIDTFLETLDELEEEFEEEEEKKEEDDDDDERKQN